MYLGEDMPGLEERVERILSQQADVEQLLAQLTVDDLRQTTNARLKLVPVRTTLLELYTHLFKVLDSLIHLDGQERVRMLQDSVPELISIARRDLIGLRNGDESVYSELIMNIELLNPFFHPESGQLSEQLLHHYQESLIQALEQLMFLFHSKDLNFKDATGLKISPLASLADLNALLEEYGLQILGEEFWDSFVWQLKYGSPSPSDRVAYLKMRKNLNHFAVEEDEVTAYVSDSGKDASVLRAMSQMDRELGIATALTESWGRGGCSQIGCE